MFKTRRDAMLTECSNVRRLPFRKSVALIKDRNILYNKERNFTYCMVEKAGTTFWRRLFYLMDQKHRTGKIVDPYSVEHYFVHNNNIPTLRNFSNIQAMDILQNSSKTLFVRDPYERIFSAYVDKLVTINEYYFNYIGSTAIRKVRINPSPRSLTCGHDLTFSELLKYLLILHNSWKPIDVHFSAMHKHCRPCEVRYDYIGHMETFNDDAKFILQNEEVFPPTVKVKFDSQSNMIDNIKSVFVNMFKSDQFNYKKCFTLSEVIQRTWRTLQLRGIIPPDKHCPVINNSDISIEKLVNMALKASDPSRISDNRHFQLVKLYKSVDIKLLEKFRKFVLQDCKLFGYDDRPSYIFNTSVFKQ